MSLQVCHCGWSKITTYHGLRTHQGKMGCTPRGVTVAESEQQFMWGHVELTDNQKDIELDVYASMKNDAAYYYSDMDLQVCHCGWSKFTTYHGLRTHQGKMGCTPKGMRIPKKEQYDWKNQWEEVGERKYQPAKKRTVKKENVPWSSSTNSHTFSAAITAKVKVEYNSSFSTPQRSSQKASKSHRQLQDFSTLPQERRSVREPPTPAYPVAVVRTKKIDRRDQTLSQVADSEARTRYWSYTDPQTAATIKEEPESPIPQRSSKRTTNPKAGHQLQDFSTLPQMHTSVREHPTPTYPLPVEERKKKKDRKEQIFSEENWSINSRKNSETTAAIKEEPKSPLAISLQSSQAAKKSRAGHQLQDFATLPQMNTSVREHPTPTYPVTVEEIKKKKERKDQTLSEENWSINSRKDSATTATIKEEPKSPLAILQQSSQTAKNSKSGHQLQDIPTSVQVTKLGRERPPIPPKVKVKELPTTTHPATAVQHKEQRREDQTLSQNVPVSLSINSATATTIKEKPKSPFSTPQQSFQKVTNSKAGQQLQASCTGLQVNGSVREVSRTPALATVVQPKEKDRKDQTQSQNVPDSMNSAAAAEATTKKDPKSVCETAQPDSSTGLKVKELAQMFSGTTTQEAAVRPKKNCRQEQNLSKVKLLAQELSEATAVKVTAVQPKEKEKEDPKLPQVQNVPDSRPPSATTQMNSASAETTTEKDPLIDFSAGMKVNELARMFSAITAQETAVRPKGKHREEQKLSQVKPLSQKVSATTAQVAAVQPEQKDKEDQNLTQVRPDRIQADVKHKIQMREQKVDQGRSSVKAHQGSVDAEWREINNVFSEVVRVAKDAQQKSPGLSLSTLRTTTSTMMEQIHQEMEKMSSIELKWISKFAVDIKLDPSTAHRCLVSADGKKVSNRRGNQEVPGRFGNVLGLNRLTSGKSYWVVVVSNKTGWNLGVARADANRRGELSLKPDNGHWVTEYYDNKFTALTAPPVHLSLKEKPQKVGVFVDYEEGLVSFYNVRARSHIYSFTECSFNGEIYPYFGLHLKENGVSADPLIISTVEHQ